MKKILAQQPSPHTEAELKHTEILQLARLFFHRTILYALLIPKLYIQPFLLISCGIPFCIDPHQLLWLSFRKSEKKFLKVAFCRICPTFKLKKLAQKRDKKIKSDISPPQSETYGWIYPPPSNSHLFHYYIFSRGSL